MITSNEEEGFAQDAPSEVAEYSYSPCPAFKDTHRRTYHNPLKLKPAPKPPCVTPQHFINKDLQQLLLSEFSAKHPLPHYSPNGSPIDANLSFDSAFDSGNLEYVIAQSRNTYDLFIRPDSNTMTHFQWFYFKVRNTRKASVTFVIKNFLKEKMSYRDGLRPFYRSSAKKQANYKQLPNSVTFGPGDASKDTDLEQFQLTFEYCFQMPNDQVQFCSQPPYTYSRLCKMYKCLHFIRMQISRTVLGNKIQAFLINQHINSKVLIVAMARQHPGQSVGSWMMQGFVNKLLQANNNFTWILIPMVNIDGVILGNNRTGVQGYDFNRHWYIEQETNRYHLFPQLKGIIAFFQRKRKQNAKRIKIYIDFHGHSSQQNVFAYGPPLPKHSQQHNISKILPFLISKRNPNFSFKQCSYTLQSFKKNCSRSVFFNKFGFTYSYTIQSSFGLYRGRRVNEDDMLRVGGDVFQSVVQFADLINDSKETGNMQIKDILNVLKEENGDCVQIKNGVYDSDSENQDENAPIRRKFEQKLTIMLTKQAEQLQGSFFDKLTKKRDNNSYLGRESRYAKVNACTSVTRNNRPRLRTEQSPKVSQTDEGHLPKLKWQEREKRIKSTKGSVTPCDLDRLSLQEMKERLMKMKHSELGRRILIIDSHHNT